VITADVFEVLARGVGLGVRGDRGGRKGNPPVLLLRSAAGRASRHGSGRAVTAEHHSAHRAAGSQPQRTARALAAPPAVLLSFACHATLFDRTTRSLPGAPRRQQSNRPSVDVWRRRPRGRIVRFVRSVTDPAMIALKTSLDARRGGGRGSRAHPRRGGNRPTRAMPRRPSRRGSPQRYWRVSPSFPAVAAHSEAHAASENRGDARRDHRRK